MDCLEFNVRQLILSDLASNVGECKAELGDPELLSTIGLIASNVKTRVAAEEENVQEDILEERAFMPISRVHCHIGFAELAINLPDTHVKDVALVLVDILGDVPHIDFDPCLAWDDWSLPDQLVFTVVSALLRIVNLHAEYRVVVMQALQKFVANTVLSMKTGNPVDVLTQFAPAFHGFYRSIISMSFDWTVDEWMGLSSQLNAFFASDLVDRLNRLLVEVFPSESYDPDQIHYIQTFIARYVSHGRPLSGYFIQCCVIESQWTVLAQALVSAQGEVSTMYPSPTEAAAANKAWLTMSRYPAEHVAASQGPYRSMLQTTFAHAMKAYAFLLVQIEEMETEPSEDSYAWETMSESLKLSAVCSAAMGQLDQGLYSRLKILLSADSQVCDNMVQEAALKSTTILVRNFPEIALEMAGHLRRFVTSPLSIFEFEFMSNTRPPPPLVAAAKCLALCVEIAVGNDLMMSHMYSLLNYIAATSKDSYEGLETTSFTELADFASLHSVELGLRGLTEDEKRTVGISTISVATRLALEFRSEEVTRLTISMLLQRLRSAEPTVEAAIAHNLVDLALVAPESSFVDIIRAFSLINRSANMEDPRFSNNMVLAAQTRLAQELHRRPDLYQTYLVELLTLFADKAVAIQNVAIQNHLAKMEDMIEQLGSLLLPIDALLGHEDFSLKSTTRPDLVVLFRNMWFLCVLFQFTFPGGSRDQVAAEWQQPALARIAVKTPAIVLEEAHDTIVSDLEYNTVIRQEYIEIVITKHRNLLTKHVPLRAGEIRYLQPGQVLFLLCMHDMETMRSAAGYPSSLVSYFTNNGLNMNVGLHACMDAIAEKVMRGCVIDLNGQAARQVLPESLSAELRKLLIGSTHRIQKAREIASKYLNRLISSFPSLMCDPALVFAVLEVLTLLRRAYENQFLDEDNPVFVYHSERADVMLKLPDDYAARDEMLSQLLRDSNNWFELALSRAPIELHSTLQKYLSVNQVLSVADSSELGASVAIQFGKAIGPIDRKLSSLSSMCTYKPDRAKAMASQLASKSYFKGEATGFRFGTSLASQNDLSSTNIPSQDIDVLKTRLVDAVQAVRERQNPLTIQDLKRLLFRCAASLIYTNDRRYDLLHYLVALPFEALNPSAVTAGIETWSWVIAEKPDYELALMSEICSAWHGTIHQERGMFSRDMNFQDAFFHPVEYSPTDKKVIDHAAKIARRLLTPHVLILQFLFSRMQAARYRRPELMLFIQRLALTSARAHRCFSTHPLAREAVFSFVLFGFETLKSSHMDVFCEHALRTSLYRAAFAWFEVSPQWSYESNRIQIDADIKLLSEFLSYLQTDSIRGYQPLSSLSPAQSTLQSSAYLASLKNLNLPLRLLVENEIYRLTVWGNPLNEAKRGLDYASAIEKTMFDSSWTSTVRQAWEVSPAIAVYLTERFSNVTLHSEVSKLVRSNTGDILDVPEALRFLVGDRIDRSVRRDLKYIIVWAPVAPVIGVSFFERRYGSDPLLLQYAHRVLEQHPVEVTFFYVPQIVQALRHDALGYVARFVFETAKISQLFCHQIIWNMKANCYKDDAGEVEDSMKPMLDHMMDSVVSSLSGEAKSFYDREFGFFNEVTSISGKLKPFIKKTKPEKKAKIDEEMAKIRVEVGVYLPSNPDGVVVDIDKKSGRPLQSHAKAPFMATFKVRKSMVELETDPENLLGNDAKPSEAIRQYDIWQQAIFKVGDDCRQDVLALQVIAMFKNIFINVGLNLYLYPYRVTATAPGCGVIDVVPNATSRDEMGRAKVNDLLDFFIAKYGGQDTIEFQQARLNFVHSMAAYSVVCYILQVKDRHNGNIMIDGDGHIVHIDFGFLFDIDEYLIFGVKFEPNSFKLTHEMVILMGGRYSQGYQLFQQLTVKAFLAIRPYAEQIISTVELMLDTGLPSFKGEPTIKRLRDRFALGYTERQAAEWMVSIIKNAHENVRSTAYDEFQRLQNGIPYK